MQLSKTFNFVLILHLILGEVTKFLVEFEKLFISEVISKKPYQGVENTTSAFRVKRVYFFDSHGI